jgi:hypothetical protein
MARRALSATSTLRFLTDQEFEDEAALLLAEFGAKHRIITAPPIPVDDILELYLKLGLEFMDMEELFGVTDVHGALWVNEQRVGIDMRLDPEVFPNKLGRYHFTLGHEAGHWRLHRHLFQRKANQLTLLPEGRERPEYICRSGSTEPIEYQANRFASCLLMPREMIKRAWHEWRGSMEPICLDDLQAKREQILAVEVLRRGGIKLGDDAIDDMLMEHAVRPLAATFEVSTEAMRIRLEGMKLLARKKEASLF